MMHRPLRFLALSVLGLSAFGCTTSTAPTGLAITTDSTSYVFATSSGPRVQVTIVNRSTRTVELAACAGWVNHRMEQEVDGRWVDATRQGCGNVPQESFLLAPGDTLRTQVTPLALGTYRVRAVLYRNGAHVLYSAESSAPFEIR